MPTKDAHTEPWVPYTMSLPDGRTVVVRVPERMTGRDRDGSVTFKVEGVKLLDRVRALAMETPSAPSPGYIKTVREALGMTQAQLAQALGRSVISVKKYEAGDTRPGKEVVQRLRKIIHEAASRGVVLAG